MQGKRVIHPKVFNVNKFKLSIGAKLLTNKKMARHTNSWLDKHLWQVDKQTNRQWEEQTESLQ